MCGECGCQDPFVNRPQAVRLKVEANLLKRTRQKADRNQDWLLARGLRALNLLSSPGSGKTTLLEKTLAHLPLSVIEGDQATERDAQRIRAAGGRVLQINTGQGCHLEPDQVRQAVEQLDPPPGVLVIENVGNLICPTFFPLGEQARVVLLSVTEGEDKPLKYPHAFKSADLVLLTKLDLLPYVPFDLDQCLDLIQHVNPGVACLVLSALSGQGMDAWLDWLRAELPCIQPT